MSRKDRSKKSCVPSLLWVHIFPCGCKFSTCRIDKMESCRHKRHRHLILSWFRAGGSDLIGRRRGIQRQGETNRQKSLWIENAARSRNRPVSPDGVHPTRAEMYPQILLRRLFQRAVSANGKKGTKTAKAEVRGVREMAADATAARADSMAGPAGSVSAAGVSRVGHRFLSRFLAGGPRRSTGRDDRVHEKSVADGHEGVSHRQWCRPGDGAHPAGDLSPQQCGIPVARGKGGSRSAPDECQAWTPEKVW